MNKWIFEEITLLKGWLLLAALMLLMVGVDPASSSTEYARQYPIFIDYIFSILHPLYILICIRYIRGKGKTSKKPPYHEIEIGIWGYFWRGYATTLVSMLPLLLFIVVFGSGMKIHWSLGTLISLVITPFVVWCLFCKNRIEFAKNAYMYLRGVQA